MRTIIIFTRLPRVPRWPQLRSSGRRGGPESQRSWAGGKKCKKVEEMRDKKEKERQKFMIKEKWTKTGEEEPIFC